MQKLRHRLQTRFVAAFALLLMLAQLGAITHAYSHAITVQSNAATADSGHAAGTDAHEFCGDCFNYAPLLAAAGAPSALPIIHAVERGANPVDPPQAAPQRAAPLAFRSRAPPASR